MPELLDHQPSSGPTFGSSIRQSRTDRGWSLRDLAERILFNRGYIGKVEQGEKFPERRFAELVDEAFNANGCLLALWATESEERQRAERVGRILTASVMDSRRLITSADERLSLNELDDGSRDLAVAYLSTAPGPMLMRSVQLRSEALRRLRDHHYRPSELADIYITLGRIQGVLSYAALDLGDANAAMTHADAAWSCAQQAGDNELRAWVRGTQSLIARFQSDYANALNFVQDGLRYPSQGTSTIRLLCGIAQCHANLGDSSGANRALDLAQAEREHLNTPDAMCGLFEFSQAKQHYYAGSSLIWLTDKADAARAAQEAAQAIEMWEHESVECRSLDDEALAHVYLGTAQLQLGDLDAAAAAIRPILDLPADRQISWIKKRLGRFVGMLRTEPYTGSVAADDLYDEIRSLAA